MKAMIFAAGLGTRLYPLTEDRPKALVEINEKPMIGHLIHKLHSFGFDEFVINVHHFAEKLIDYLQSKEFSAYQISISDESAKLLDTGGALIKARELLQGDSPVLLHNVDIWTNINYADLVRAHNVAQSFATLAVRDRETSRYLLFNDDSELVGWKNIKTGEVRPVKTFDNPTPLAFSGIQMVSQDFLKSLSGNGKFSIIESYLDAAKSNQIKAFVHQADFWMDLGKPEAIDFLNQNLQ
ncbi:MAG: nucleotidyltransferase family protein [Bacteroidales bacterium]|jgi:NDP-sugar pyrophosphorylase family protein|nr:nucleotidyltransferase family protein [Bacteroidales bacterium]